MAKEPAALIFGTKDGEFFLAIETAPFKHSTEPGEWLDKAEAYGPFGHGIDASYFLQTDKGIVGYQFAPHGYYPQVPALGGIIQRAVPVDVPSVKGP